MGCLNSTGNFSHWFGNIHFSGPCNRSCSFFLGQHMMALDAPNNLHTFPLKGLDEFIEACKQHGVNEINLTGSNTDPLLYKHIGRLKEVLHQHLPRLVFGLRTNGALALRAPAVWNLFDKASISITSLDPQLYCQTMGQGTPPNVEKILRMSKFNDIKINIVLCPETVYSNDVFKTINKLVDMGATTINLREPYGQPHIGDPMERWFKNTTTTFGMPTYRHRNAWVTYWDVHYVEVESVNLYANGIVSTTYPITKGHDPVTGAVQGQEHFTHSGRIRPQWVTAS